MVPEQIEREIIIGLPVVAHAPTEPPSVGFTFGSNQLWVDRVEGLSQAELWLEVSTSDVPAAARHVQTAGVDRRDEIEPLPDGLEGFWISSPASIIHLVASPDQF
jgi:hypothetical protein